MTQLDPMSLSRVLGRLFMRLSGLSWRVRYIRPCSGRAGTARGRTVLFAFWHGRQLPLIHTHRNEGVTVLVSRNTDGQYVTNVLHSMGFHTVRGSSSRGGMEALRGMAERLRNGRDCAITPDGPRGPAECAKAGTAWISRLGACSVVPMGTAAWPSVRFSSWDRFMLPFPFSRVVVVEGRPIRNLKRGEDPNEWLAGLEACLGTVTSCADLLAAPVPRTQAFLLRLLGRTLAPMASLALLFRPERERWERRGEGPAARGRPVWLHGSSLGELKGLLPFIDELRGGNVPVHVTCFTPPGRRFMDDHQLPGGFLPLDVPGYIGRFLDRVHPRALVLAETEIWPNTLMDTLCRGVPCVLVNGRLSEKSLRRYRPFAALIGGILSCFSAVMARTCEDMDRFAALGVNGKVLSVSGDSKFLADCGDPPPEWRGLLGTDLPVLVAGSTRKGEEETVLEAASSAGYFPVIAPRHLERVDEVESLMRRMGFSPVRWSTLAAGFGEELDFDSVITDVHGVLAALYGIGDAAFVGGTLAPLGGHNVLEPLMRGVPLLVGPHHWNFREAVDGLIESRAAVVISGPEELAAQLDRMRTLGISREEVLSVFRKLRESRMRNLLGILRSAGMMEDHGEA